MTAKSSPLPRLLPGFIIAAALSAGSAQSQTPYSQAILADKPLFYWNFDQEEIGDGIVQQVPGAAVTTENDLQAVQSASRVTHESISSGLRLGSTASLDGGGYFASSAALRAGKPQLTGAYALEMWIQSGGAGTPTYLANFGLSPGGDNSPALIYNFQGPVLELYGAGGGRTGDSGPGFDDQAWHHVLVVYHGNGTDGVGARTDIYLDGTLATGLEGISRRLSLANLIVGAALPNGANAFTGNIDELAVYDLQAKELADEAAVEAWASGLVTRHRASALAASGPAYSTVVKADTPLLYWNFDETDPTAPAVQQMPLTDATAGENLLLPEGSPVLSTHTELGSTLKLGRAADLVGNSFFHARPLTSDTGISSLPGPYVVELWLQSQADNGGAYLLNFGDYTAAGDNSPAVIYNFDPPAPLHLELFGGGGGRTALSGPIMADQGWHHLVAVYYGGGGSGVADRLDFYFDKQNYPRVGPVVKPLSLGGLVAGAGLLNGANQFTGRIDELAVYDLSDLPDEAAVTAKVSSMVEAHFTAAGGTLPETVVTIGTQPQGKTANIGDTMVFSVSATVTGTNEPLIFQWFRDGLALVGEVAATYTIPALTLGDVGTHNYTVRVSAGQVFKDSAAAALTVNAPPPLAQTAYAKQVIADAPLLYWNFDEASGPAVQLMPLDPAPAAGANDMVPSVAARRADHAAIASGLNLGYTADFAGNSYFKKLLETNLSELNGPFGVELWIQSLGDNPNTYLVNFGNHEVAGGDNSPALIYNFNAGYLELFGPARTTTEGPPLDDNEWHHLMYVFYGNDSVGVAPLLEIYLDGQVYSITNTTAWRVSLAGVLVGAALPNGVNGFTGRLDEIAIHDFSTAFDEAALRSRVQSLITTHMQAATTVTPPATASISMSVSGSNVTLTWSAGAGAILQESPDLGTWTTVNGAASPLTVPLPASGKKFYRLARP
ncbi:MAG: hypothetical protein JWM59_4461 [Verrucomicrobiales bacterium]|nr:hypothetical protein [Verrucomicrobiales bacterium]